MKCIRYKLMTEVNHGTEENPDIVQIFNNCEITCSDDQLEANIEIAKSEAYNGEVVVEDVEEVVEEPTQLDIIEAQVTYTAMMTNTLLEV